MGHRSVFFLLAVLLISTCTGCQSTYYAVWEKLGKEKRHLLKEQVQDTRAEQAQASEEFKDVLTRIQELYGFDGGDLEKYYNKLQSDYEACARRAESVDERIQSVDRIAKDLFKEWGAEIKEISNPQFRAKSRASLSEAEARYARLHRSMTAARTKMTPVLTSLRDYVLYLKHNLNAQAVGALKQEIGSIEAEVDDLIAEIRKSISEADDFIKNFD